MSHKRIATGGPLNALNELAGTNQRSRSVSVMALVSNHRPRTPEELASLIEEHSKEKCDCGIISQGTVLKFGLNLFEAQFNCASYISQFGPHRSIFSEDECYQFMYNLFCVAPLRGIKQEERSKSLIRDKLSSCMIVDASIDEDFLYGVDYVVKSWDESVAAGIQVKPESFFKKHEYVDIQRLKHETYHLPVMYHIYHNDSLKFTIDSTNEIVNFFADR